MSKSITQDMAYRQSLMKYAEKYGVSRVQQKPVVHLLLEAALGRECGVPGLPVQTPSQPPQPAHGGRAKAHPRYAPPQSVAGYDRAVAPSAEARLHPLSGELVPRYAQNGAVSGRKAQKSVQAKALGIERISNSSLRVMPFETIAEYPPIKFTPNSSATRSNVCAIFT